MTATAGRADTDQGTAVTGPAPAVRAVAEPGSGVTITVCPDGPLLVRGPATLLSAAGEAVEHERRVIALCRCGRSRLKPLCDGSHRLNRFRDPASADQLDRALNHASPAVPESTGA